MKIATVGSCQAMALNWYIRQLRPDDEVKWCAIELFSNWHTTIPQDKHNELWLDQGSYNIYETKPAIEYLKSADYIVYQCINSEKSKLFNPDQIQLYKKTSTKTCTLPYFKVCHDEIDPLAGLKERERKMKLDFKISDILLFNDKKAAFKFNSNGVHPNSALCLEIVRNICNVLNWPFYSDKQYIELIESYYPFGKYPI